MSTPAFTRQFSYQFASPITDLDHENWPLVGTVDNSFEVTLDTDYAIIIKIGNTGDMPENGDLQLQYNVDGAGWNDVNSTSSNVRTTGSGDADGQTSATERLTTSARTFGTSEVDDVEGLNVSGITGGGDNEYYYAITFRSAELGGGETITFKLVIGGSDPSSIDITPTATVAAGAGGYNSVPTIIQNYRNMGYK